MSKKTGSFLAAVCLLVTALIWLTNGKYMAAAAFGAGAIFLFILFLSYRKKEKNRLREQFSDTVETQLASEEKNMKKFIKEFKEFAMKGNVLDMAVGVVIGAAFKAIVDSLVNDLLNPILGLVANKDLSDYAISLSGDASIKYGAFISAIINFVIMALVIFLMVKAVAKIRDFGKKKEEPPAAPAAPTTKICPYCKSEIPIGATRCGHCTSVLEESKPE